jgi:hypothetical protein
MKVFASLFIAALLALPAAAQADMHTFGSDLSAPASVEDEHQADTVYFNTPGQANSLASPVDGEVVAVRIKGTIVPRPNNAETTQIDRLFHIQTLKPNGSSNYTVLTSSDGFYFPYNVDPDTISTYRSAGPQCVSAGDVVNFNDIGGWHGMPADPSATRYRIFARSPGNNVSWYTADNGTNTGSTWTTSPIRDQELLMQVVVATGYDAATNCPGGRMGQEYKGVSIGTPNPAPKVYDDGVARARVVCPENTYQGCDGTVHFAVDGKEIGSNTFKLNRSESTNVQVRLTNEGAGILTQRGKLDVAATVESKDGYGVPMTTTGTVTLTSARAVTGTAFVGTTGRAQTFTYKKGAKPTLKLTCPAGTTGACTGKISIKSQTRVKLSKKDKKGKVYSLGSASYTIAAGKTVRIPFKIPSAGLKALKKVKTIVGIATVTSADGAGHSASERVKITFKYKA